MKVYLNAVLPKGSRAKPGPRADCFDQLVAEYVTRCAHYVPLETQVFRSEEELLISLDSRPGRTEAHAVLLDSRGKQLSSEEFAAHLGRLRDNGTQRVVLAIGPADGWSPAALKRADLVFSLGRITLPHQLARVVLAEQVYRAFTILSGHPYHSGH